MTVSPLHRNLSMKHLLTTLACALLLAVATPSRACTNFIVGKNASADGSVIVSYSADNYGLCGNMYHSNRATHPAGAMRQIYDWDTNEYHGQIPEAAQTYTVNGQMNEWQVTITETTFGGRMELCDTTGIIDYGSLIYIGLERSKSAREAIQVMTSLVAQYGYCSSGESFTIADKNEAWILEMVGKGPGVKGAVWVAVRIPDDCISGHANQSRITTFDQKDKQNVLYSKDVIKLARQKGWFSGKDADFSFRDAYCPLDYSGIRICDARVWSFFRRHADGMDAYLPYINGEDNAHSMPLYVKPNRPLSVRDVQNAMRDHYEDTPLDIRHDIGAGPYEMPYRPTPLFRKVNGTEYYNERPTSTQQSGFSFVGQMRSAMPDPVGGIVWWTNDDANMAAFTPVYCASTEAPQCYLRVQDVRDEITFSWESAFWLENLVANIVYPYYSKMFPDLLQARNELEDAYEKAMLATDTEARTLYDESPEKAVAYLTDYSLKAAQQMMTRWEQLFRYIVVKHNDMAVRPEAGDRFQRTKEGLGAPLQRPGYSDQYWQRIIGETGERYKMK